MKLVNLTPHTITIIGDHYIQEFAPSGMVARVNIRVDRIGSVIKNIPLVVQRISGIEGLPDPQEGIGYIVSNMVLQALKGQGVVRTDCYAPDTSSEGIVKNYSGKTIGVRGLTQSVIS